MISDLIYDRNSISIDDYQTYSSITMPVVACPIPNCTYVTDDVDAIIAVALLNTHAITHAPTSSTNAAAAKVERVKRPTVTSAGSSEEWDYFLVRWRDYVEATKVSGKDRIIQLLECCDEQLRKDVTRSIGMGRTLTDRPEEEILTLVRTLAVREENTMVARVTLHNMRPDRDETVRSFSARIRGQAGVCKFSLPCPNCTQTVNYTEEVLRDVVIRGLEDPEIQLDLLGDKNQDMNFEEVLRFVEAKEAGKRSASRLVDTHGAEAAKSSYTRKRLDRLQRQHEPRAGSTDQNPCSYCGKKGHGRNAPQDIRRTECPAYNSTCTACHKKHHFEVVCRGKYRRKREDTKVELQEGAVFDSLCIINNTGRRRNERFIALDHHLYNQLSDTWLKQSSKPQPFVKLGVDVLVDDYKLFGFDSLLTRTPRHADILCMADTGCQSCLAGIKAIHRLGINQRELIPVTMKMHAANKRGINIIGTAILRFSGRTSNGVLETRQIVYVTDVDNKVFLSREACVALGMITEQFPKVGEITRHTAADATSDAPDHLRNNSGLITDCNCPKRELPPPPPTQLPCPATDDNCETLRQFLLDYYKGSTFNTCEHQPLPMMSGPPLQLMIDPDAKPFACHSPI
ncbi:hypothetical protein DJ031_00325, partial [bacterium endosymbiont of Escarpia laminata]